MNNETVIDISITKNKTVKVQTEASFYEIDTSEIDSGYLNNLVECWKKICLCRSLESLELIATGKPNVVSGNIVELFHPKTNDLHDGNYFPLMVFGIGMNTISLLHNSSRVFLSRLIEGGEILADVETPTGAHEVKVEGLKLAVDDLGVIGLYGKLSTESTSNINLAKRYRVDIKAKVSGCPLKEWSGNLWALEDNLEVSITENDSDEIDAEQISPMTSKITDIDMEEYSNFDPWDLHNGKTLNGGLTVISRNNLSFREREESHFGRNK